MLPTRRRLPPPRAPVAPRRMSIRVSSGGLNSLFQKRTPTSVNLFPRRFASESIRVCASIRGNYSTHLN